MQLQERRQDPLFRTVIELCQLRLQRAGYALAGRGRTEQETWVQFEPARGQDSTHTLPRLRLAHNPDRRWLAAELQTGLAADIRPQGIPGPRLRQYYPQTAEGGDEVAEAALFATALSDWVPAPHSWIDCAEPVR
jgi:hypothetical protein